MGMQMLSVRNLLSIIEYVNPQRIQSEGIIYSPGGLFMDIGQYLHSLIRMGFIRGRRNGRKTSAPILVN